MRRTPCFSRVFCSSRRGELDPVEQRLEGSIRRGAGFRIERFGGAGEIVGDCKHVAREAGNAIGTRVGDVALGALADILRFGDRAQVSCRAASMTSGSSEGFSGATRIVRGRKIRVRLEFVFVSHGSLQYRRIVNAISGSEGRKIKRSQRPSTSLTTRAV